MHSIGQRALSGCRVSALMCLLVGIAGSSGPCDDATHYEQGLKAVDENRLADAATHLQAALQETEDPQERAKIDLLLGFVLEDAGQYDAAIEAFERVLAYDPHFRQDYPAQKIHGLTPQGQLGFAYRGKGDLNAAVFWWEKYLEWCADAPRIVGLDVTARRTLAERGELQAPPVVFMVSPWGCVIPSKPGDAAGRLLVPATALGRELGVRCIQQDDRAAVSFVPDEGATLKMHAGSSVGVIDGEVTRMELPPELIEGEIWVPFRFTTEALGYAVVWDATRRIATVRKLPPSRDEALEAVRTRDVPLAVKLLPRAIEEAPTPEEQAKLRLLLALMYEWNDQFDEAIAELHRVAECDPNVIADFPQQRIEHLSVDAGLGTCYWRKGDLNTAIYWWEKCLGRDREAGEILGPIFDARKELAARGELQAAPMVICGGFIPSRFNEAEGRLLVPATRLAENLRVRCLRSEQEQVVTFVPDEGASVVLRVGSREARIGAEAASAPVSPVIIEGEIWVPFRFTTEALGYVIVWDGRLRIAKVWKPRPAGSGPQKD